MALRINLCIVAPYSNLTEMHIYQSNSGEPETDGFAFEAHIPAREIERENAGRGTSNYYDAQLSQGSSAQDPKIAIGC